jgi:hypothetical protein
VPATVSTIKRKLPGTLLTSPWQLESSGGGWRNLTANFAPDGFLRSNDKKVCKSNLTFYR